MRHPNRGGGLRRNYMTRRWPRLNRYSSIGMREIGCWYCLPGRPQKYIQEIEEEEECMNVNDELTCSTCCFHVFTGPIWMVVPDGHVVQKCCHCSAMRTIHRCHMYENAKNF